VRIVRPAPAFATTRRAVVIRRTLVVDWPFAHGMPMPAVYHLRIDEQPKLPAITGSGPPTDAARTAET